MIIRLGGHEWHFGLWRVLGLLIGIGFIGGLVFFGYSISAYYFAIRGGEVNPLFDRRFESSVSRLAANQQVTNYDLERLVDSEAPFLGSINPDLVIVEFLDYGCPYSRAAFEPVRELVMANADRVKLIIRDFPLDEARSGPARAATAARCAQEQDKFWVYHDKLFLNQDKFSDEELGRYAAEGGLDVNRFEQCLASSRTESLVEADKVVGVSAGVQGTPTFFFNGQRIQGALDEDALGFIIREFLKQADSSRAS